MKKHFILFSTFAALLLSATLLTACGEDVQELADNGNNGETVTETTVGENCTLFSSGDDGTRTALGTDRKFYWSEGDQIYVNTDGANYKKTSSSTLSSDKRTADFVLEGVQLIHSPCSVMYIGNGTTAATATKNDLKVKIEATQTQAAWGDTAHIGRSGDCGVAEAKKDKTTGKYSFTLKHKASYLVIQPYRPTGTANPDWKLMKIEIITDGTTKVAGEYNFGTGELVGAGSSNTIEFNCGTNGFDLNHTAPATAKSCFAVIQPGQHELTIRYSVKITKKPNVLYFDANGIIENDIMIIDKPIASRPYNANAVTTIKHTLSPNPYYCWDAPADQPYDYSLWGNNYNYSTLIEPASRSCKDMPNANELYWYIVSGDPRRDDTTPWSNDGGLTERTGGIWIMTRAAILSAGRTFDPNVGKDNVDMRTPPGQTHTVSTTAYQTGGRPADTSNYFFLPAQGYYYNGSPSGSGTYGYYWSSSPDPGNGGFAYALYSRSGAVRLYTSSRLYGFVAGSQWFR